MAVDDNNPSKRPPMNRSANPNPVNGIFEGISSGAGFMSAEHRARLATIAGDASAISDLTSLVDITSGDMNRANLFDQIAKRQTSFNRLTEQVNGSDLQATRRAGREASNFIARSYSSSAMNGEANRWVSDPDVQMRAMGMSSTPWNDLQAGRQNVMNQLGELKRQTREAAQGMYTGRAQIVPEKLEAVNALYQQKATLEKELGVFTAAERYQRGQGLDPTSQTANIGRGVQLANKLLGQSQLSQDIASGGISINRDGQTVKIGTADIGRETINQAGRVQGAQAKLDAAVAQNVPNLQPFNDALKEATAGLTKLHEAAGTVGDSGGAPGSSFARKMGMVSDIAQAASAGFMASSFQQQNINVGIPMQRAANIAGTSAIENQRYQAYKGSQQGDVLSMMMMPEFNRARQFGQEMGEASQEALKTKTSGHGMGWIAGAGALAGGAVIAGGALLSGTGIGSAVGIPVMAAGAKLLALSTGVGAIAGGASYMMGEKANVNVTTAQAEAGTIRGAARVGGAAAYLQAQMAEKQISAEQLQGVVNFGRGLGGVAQGLGGAGGEAYLQSTVGNPAFLKNLTDKRIGMEQFTNLSQQGAGVQGSLFNANQIFTARGLERTGYGSMENTMTNMNLMSRAGSNNPEASWMGQLTTGFRP